MNNSRPRHTIRLIVGIIVCTGSVAFGLAVRDTGSISYKSRRPPQARASDEKIIERKEFPNEPFEFGNLTVQSTRVGVNQKFNSVFLFGSRRSSDWLESLGFTLKNTSQKQITYIHLELDFPETSASGSMMVYNQLGIGIDPRRSSTIRSGREPLALNPGETITFAISAKEMASIKDFLSADKYPLGSLNKAVIRLGYIIFSDGSKWEQGDYYQPSLTTPGGYEHVTGNRPINQ
ncbi:MAG: hypothetical protein DMF61_08645 [Blastocatellia bacterium AA13]|nr:MAG: hypothetical protein DMF61_08645 [Blastocatellia bacterium AA13]